MFDAGQRFGGIGQEAKGHVWLRGITETELKRCSKSSDNAKLVLGRDVPSFVIDGEWLQPVQPRVRYIDEDITNEADNMTREE